MDNERDAEMVPVLLSREALRALGFYRTLEGSARRPLLLVMRDLQAVLDALPFDEFIPGPEDMAGILAARAKTRVVQVSGETIEALRRGIELGHRASAAMCADGGQAQRERDEQVNYVFSLFVRDLERLLKDPLS